MIKVKEVYEIKKEICKREDKDKLRDSISNIYPESSIFLNNNELILNSNVSLESIQTNIKNPIKQWLGDIENYPINYFYSILPLSNNNYMIKL